MLLKKIGRPTKAKKITYLSLSVILGIILSFNLHAFVEMAYLRWVMSSGREVIFYGGCALPNIVQVLIWVLGIVGGYFIGKFWWQKIYIERFWEKQK